MLLKQSPQPSSVQYKSGKLFGDEKFPACVLYEVAFFVRFLTLMIIYVDNLRYCFFKL